MAHLVQMRQRIKAVETIRKITHAMRLISMSTHSRLRNKKQQLETYKKAFQRLAVLIKQETNKQKLDQLQTLASDTHLIILVASQKGLCGSFNSHLFRYFEREALLQDNYSIITVGKYATEYIRDQRHKTPLLAFNNFNSTQFVSIAQQITQIILSRIDDFQTVTVYSNFPRTFFAQKPQKTFLLPLPDMHDEEQEALPSDLVLEQTPQELSLYTQNLMITVTLQELLFESLLSEQAARFISMDNSTRNAENLLNAMKLEYNKIRQAAITRELTELASSI